MGYGYSLKMEQNNELANKVSKDEEQPWKRWFLVSDEHPLESGKYNYGGIIIRKPPAIIQHGQFSKEKVYSPINQENIYKKMRLQNSFIISYWIRKLLFTQNKQQFDKNMMNTIIKYTLYISLSWHSASFEDGAVDIINSNTLSVCNNGINIGLMNYICDWNHLYIDKKEKEFGVKLRLKQFNNPIAFGLGFIVINHLTQTPYISNWSHLMDFPDTNIGFGVFFIKQQDIINDKQEELDNVYAMMAFCEPRLYGNYLIERRFNDGKMVQLNQSDEIKIVIQHKIESSFLYINNQEISEIFFGTPPYVAPAMHYVGQDNKIKSVFECDFA